MNISEKDLENSDTESELSDYNLQELFQENIIFNMGATEAEIRRVMERALGLTANALNAPLAAGETIREKIENAGNEAGGVISMPMFYGKEEEDVK